MTIRIEYDSDADALYVRLRDLPYSFGEDIDQERRIDYAEGGEPIGVEILCVSKGVNTDGLPDRAAVIEALDEQVFVARGPNNCSETVNETVSESQGPTQAAPASQSQ